MLPRSGEGRDWLKLQKELTTRAREQINASLEKLTDSQVLEIIETLVLTEPALEGTSFQQKKDMVGAIFNATRRELGILQPYADSGQVSEIMVNGTDSIFIERAGRMVRLSQKFETPEELEEIIRRLAGRVHREINELSPIVDARMEDGSRVNAVYKNVALNGPILTIRRFPKKGITMEQLLSRGTLSKQAAAFLQAAVGAGLNIFISGGTSSGKTTFLNVLSSYIPKEERVIVIEDSAELQIREVENLVRLETKSANAQGKGEVNMRQLIRTSLRMRPDRIIVGEVRGEEVLDMIQAMNTGHDGSLSTGHGNSCEGMLCRLEAMFLTAADFPVDAIRTQIAEALDLIVHLSRMPDKSRKVLEIKEVVAYREGRILLNPLFLYQKEQGLVATGNRLKNRMKWEMKGVEPGDGL